MLKKISKEDKAELIGQIIDVFEDFLDEKGIVIETPEEEENQAIIYGDDYYQLEDKIAETLINWNLLEQDD